MEENTLTVPDVLQASPGKYYFNTLLYMYYGCTCAECDLPIDLSKSEGYFGSEI